MNTYILLVVNGEGIQHRQVTEADSVGEAIEKFEFYPFNPTDFLQKADRGIRKEWERGGEDIAGWVWDRIRERASSFYNTGRFPRWDGRQHGNYIEGDSHSLHVIIEAGEEGVCFYPGPARTYKPEEGGGKPANSGERRQ